MRLDIIVSEEDRIFKISNDILSKLLFVVSTFFILMLKRKEIHVNHGLSIVIGGFGYVAALLCYLSTRIKSIRYISVIMISLFIMAVGSFQQMNISILYIIPIYIAYFLQNRKKIYSILILDIIFFNLSKLFKAYNIYIVNPNVYQFKFILISTVVTSVIESIVFLSIAIPVYMLLIRQNKDLKVALQEKDDATNDILQFCSTATSFHNKYLSVHINGVRDITKVILDGLIEEGVYIESYYYDQIIFSVQFHDIGKIYIDSSILDKRGKLDTEEFDLIKEHPARGLELFNLLPKNVLDENYIQTCKNVIYQHHERLDGKGYPTGTTQISFEAKIVAIADVVDALLSWRPYKPPLSWDKVVEILEETKEGFNYECIKVVYEKKDKILEISNRNNEELKKLLSLNESDIVRQ